MLEKIKNYFFRRLLKKNACNGKTGLLPLSEISSAAVLMNVEDPEFEACKDVVIKYFKSKGIKCELYFLDFRKIERDELLLTSIQNTFIRKDLNILGLPSPEKLDKVVFKQPCDLFFSLVRNEEYTNVYISACIEARFKIGCVSYEGNPYDMVVSADSMSQSIKSAWQLLEKIV